MLQNAAMGSLTLKNLLRSLFRLQKMDRYRSCYRPISVSALSNRCL